MFFMSQLLSPVTSSLPGIQIKQPADFREPYLNTSDSYQHWITFRLSGRSSFQDKPQRSDWRPLSPPSRRRTRSAYSTAPGLSARWCGARQGTPTALGAEGGWLCLRMPYSLRSLFPSGQTLTKFNLENFLLFLS